MHCVTCNKELMSRSAYLIHISKCNQNKNHPGDDKSDSESEESNEYDSDVDPPWFPSTSDEEAEIEPLSSPVTLEQQQAYEGLRKIFKESPVMHGSFAKFDPVEPTNELRGPSLDEADEPQASGNYKELTDKMIEPSLEKMIEPQVLDKEKDPTDKIGPELERMTIEPGLDKRVVPQTSVTDEEKDQTDKIIRPVLENLIVPGISGSEKEALFVDKSKREGNKRIWNKKDCCIFCEQMVTNFTRHLYRKHSEEMEVCRALAKPKGSKERKNVFETLRKKGNFYHNKNCLRQNSGNLIVVQRPASQTTAPVKNYLPCKSCLGFFSRKRLYRHLKECKSRQENDTSRYAQSIGSTLLVVNRGCSEELKNNVLKIMKNDEVSTAVKNDSLICEFGSRMLKNHNENHLKTVISQKMRELGRLLLNLNSSNQSKVDLAEYIKPEHYENIVRSVKELAGYNSEAGSYKTPSIATKLGHSLRACADILECLGIISTNPAQSESAKQFNFIMSKQWKYDISSNALKSLHQAKWNTPTLLPLAEDIRQLHSYIGDKERDLPKDLKLNTNQVLWRELAEVTLVHVILLNRRRAGEAERIEVSRYVNRDTTGHREDVAHSLSETEKTLCKSLTRFEIRGKRGRGVPVLLTPVMKSNFDLLLETREVVDVLPENPYMFAVPKTKNSCMRGSAVVKKYADLSGAKDSAKLTSTHLRKHIATMSQILNLSPNDMEQLATYMGHDLSIHKQYYRLPENTFQVAKISKVLLLMEKGKIQTLNDKTLDDLNIDLNEEDVSEDDEELPQLQPSTSIQLQPSTSISMSEVDNAMSCNVKQNSVTVQQSRVFKRRKTCVKKPWSEDEKEAVLRHFRKHVLMKKVPNKKECDKCLDTENVLLNRTWAHVKFFVKNMFNKAV